MKKLILIFTVMFAMAMLFAEESPVNDYFDNPSNQTYTAAWQFCSNYLANDSTMVNIKILMANIAMLESKRLINEISTMADTLSAGVKFQYANVLLAQNRLIEAIKQYNALNTAYPGWSCPFRHKGEAYYRLQNYKEAEASLAKAIETNLEHYDAYVWMARTQYQMKKYKKALTYLKTALTLNPEAEESPDEMISEDSIKALHDELLVKTGKKK